MSQQIPIYCINLKRATERKELIQKEWIDKLGFEINFFDAFDKREIEENNLYRYPYHVSVPILKIKRPLSFGEIACCTSYCLLTEQIMKLDIDKVILMEDDIFPLFDSKNYFFDMIEKGVEEYPDAEIFMLHKPLDHWLWKLSDDKFYEKKQYFSLLKNAPWGTQLFYVNKKQAIRSYHDALEKMQYPADFVWNDIYTPYKKMIYANNPLVHHENTENGTTYIGNEYRGIHRKYIV